MKIIHWFFIPISFVSWSCIEQDVRLYVGVDESCAHCCKDVEFPIELNGKEVDRVTASNQVLIERQIATTAAVGVLADVDEPEGAGTSQCLSCAHRQLNRSLLLQTSGISPGPIVYYDSVIFENEDLHINIKCSE